MDFDEIYKKYRETVDKGLEAYIPKAVGNRKIIYDAMKYSLLAGGKRIRPVLLLAVCDVFGYPETDALPFAVAIEMIHTYSLIHDDLPAMDNDDLRRGIPTSHKVFGEGIAILAGDALLNTAFEIMTKEIVKNPNLAYTKAVAMNIIANSAGVDGMIGGQVIDLESEGKSISYENLREMHTLKTGALLKAPIIAAAKLSQIDDELINILDAYASRIGLAFQIKDDILDVEGTTEKLGKNAGSDESNCKATFVTLFGLTGAKQKLIQITDEAISSIRSLDFNVSFLEELAIRLSSRAT